MESGSFESENMLWFMRGFVVGTGIVFAMVMMRKKKTRRVYRRRTSRSRRKNK